MNKEKAFDQELDTNRKEWQERMPDTLTTLCDGSDKGSVNKTKHIHGYKRNQCSNRSTHRNVSQPSVTTLVPELRPSMTYEPSSQQRVEDNCWLVLSQRRHQLRRDSPSLWTTHREPTSPTSHITGTNISSQSPIHAPINCTTQYTPL